MIYRGNIIDIDVTLLCVIFCPVCLYASFFFIGMSFLCFCQAYTMELEAEVAKLKEENKELQRKQVLLFHVASAKELKMR